MQKRFILIILLGTLLCGSTGFAQLLTGNMFLQGRFLEIGSMANASLGSSVNAPLGYHPHNSSSVYLCSTSSSNLLAEVYDYGHDGWTVGSPPYMGDYTLPGSPWEGWAIEVAGTSCYAYSTSCGFTGSLTGSWFSYANTGGRALGYWHGSTASGALAIRKEYRIDTLGSALVVSAVFTNTSAAPLAGVYYMRSCDPDNDESWIGGSGFTTENTIDYQNDYYHRVQVTAKAYGADSTHFSLATKDCRARAFIYNSWPLSTGCDLGAVWAESAGCLGGSYWVPQILHTGDIAIGLVYNIGTIAAGDSALISYAYVFNGEHLGIDSAFPSPELVANGVAHYFTDTETLCSNTLPVHIINGTDRAWTWSDWTWSPAVGLAATTGVTNTIDGSLLSGITTYTITGSNSRMADCVTDTFYLTVIPVISPTPTPRDTTYCLGIAAPPLSSNVTGTGTLTYYTTATGGTGTTVAPTPSTTTLGTTTYYISQVVTGCESPRAALNITIAPPPVISVGNNSPLCPGSTLDLTVTDTLTGGVITYSWTGPGGWTSTAANPVIAAVTTADSGVFSLILDHNGCSTYPTLDTVVVHSTPPSPVFTNPTYCQYLSSVPLSATGTNILWYTTATGGFGSTIAPTPSTLTPGVFTWYVTQTIFGCESARYPVTVTVNAKPVPPTIIDNPGEYCPGQAFNTFTIVSGTNILWYAGSSGGAGSPVAPVVNTNIPGTYTFWASQTVLGCEGDRSPVTILVYDSVKAHFGYVPHLGCHGDTILFTNSSYGGVNYLWDFGDGASSAAANPTHIYLNQGVYTVKLFAHSFTCVDSLIQTIDTRHPDTARFTLSPGIVCQGHQVTFTNASIGASPVYSWNFGDGATSNLANPNHSYANTGTYTISLVATNFVPCSDTAYASVAVDSSGPVSFTLSDSILCLGTYVTVDADYTSIGNTGMVWYFGDGDSVRNVNPVTYGYPSAGTYNITVTASYRVCPVETANRTVHVYTQPTINLGSDSSICAGSEAIVLTDYINSGITGASWLWSTGATGPSITVTAAGSYYATVSLGGCTATDSVNITDNCYLAVPNIFSPNGDGVNDYFNPRDYLKGLRTFKLTIFDRWGQVVFETTSLDGRGWDGMLNGVEQPQGVYIYSVEATFIDGQSARKNGNLTLIR